MSRNQKQWKHEKSGGKMISVKKCKKGTEQSVQGQKLAGCESNGRSRWKGRKTKLLSYMKRFGTWLQSYVRMLANQTTKWIVRQCSHFIWNWPIAFEWRQFFNESKKRAEIFPTRKVFLLHRSAKCNTPWWMDYPHERCKIQRKIPSFVSNFKHTF